MLLTKPMCCGTAALISSKAQYNTSIDALCSQGSIRPVPRHMIVHVDLLGAKSLYRSEMMRRNLEGKLDGDGIKRGEFTEAGVTIVAPFVVGKVAAPKVAPLELGIEKMSRTIPQGMTEAQFGRFSQMVRESKASQYGTDIRVHGSRAADTAKKTSDIDVAIRVSPEKFNQILKESFKNVNPVSSKADTLQHAIEVGKISRRRLGLSGFGKQLAKEFNLSKVDISIIREGGAFDQGHWISQIIMRIRNERSS